MTNNTDNLILKHLQALRAGQEDTNARLNNITEGLNRVNIRLAALEDGMSGFLTVAAADRAKTDRLEQRIQRIERRLEISD